MYFKLFKMNKLEENLVMLNEKKRTLRHKKASEFNMTEPI